MGKVPEVLDQPSTPDQPSNQMGNELEFGYTCPDGTCQFQDQPQSGYVGVGSGLDDFFGLEFSHGTSIYVVYFKE